MTQVAPTKTAYVETYGCQMNISDGELMKGILAARGYRLVATPEDADVIFVNTCAIRDHAEQRVLGRVAQLGQLKTDRPDLVIAVTGCMAERLGTRLLERAPHVDLVMGPDGYRQLAQRLAELEALRDATADPPTAVDTARPSAVPRPHQLAVLGFEPQENYEGLEVLRTSGVSAWVPIQRGCNHRCTFCIVPYVRGPEKNRHPEHVLDEIRSIADGGISEVTLLGQTVNSYRYEDWDFARLLQSVARVPGIRRVRFTSPYPGDVTRRLLEVMAEEPAVCEQLHLPVQAGSNRTLKRMLRRYTVETFLEKMALAREIVAGIALSTDVIVAFPGETEEEFEATLDLMRTVRFDEAFTYKYSPREGTPATRLPPADFVAPAVAQDRLERLIQVQREIQKTLNEAEVGKVEEVLVERTARGAGQVLGRTRRNKVVAFPGDAEWIGRFVAVELTATTGATFVGRTLDSSGPPRSGAAWGKGSSGPPRSGAAWGEGSPGSPRSGAAWGKGSPAVAAT